MMEENSILSQSYVKLAESRMEELKNYKGRGYFKITTSQIRKLLSILNDIYAYAVSVAAKSSDDEDVIKSQDQTLKEKMEYFKMRCIYESGRDEYTDKSKSTGVHDFIEVTEIIDYLDKFDKVDDHKDLHASFIWIFHYMESLVAYHRFLGGKDSER